MRRLTIALTAVALTWPAAAAADSNLSYTGDTVTVSGSPNAFSLTVTHPLKFTGGFPPILISSYRVESTEGLNNLSASCNDESSGEEKAFSCSPIPALTSVAGSPEGDTIAAGCGVLFSSPRIAVQAGDGADTLTGGCSTDDLDGGPGDDSVAGGNGADQLSGGSGDDALQAGSQDDVANGNAGSDSVSGGEGSDQLLGESGKDALIGAAGDDSLDGGADRDTLDGGEGNDSLQGGDGRDLLLPGAGTDVVGGGSSLDTVSYEDRKGGAPLRISLNATADDGADGENDAIAGDVENVIGSPGPDTINGDDGPNDLDAGDSNDTIEPAGGADFVDAGSGDDRVTSRDGAQDRIECGPGIDTAVIDEFDVVSNCENVQASRELMADVDNDGIPAPADCDDRNGAIRPGIPDTPGNRVDDDCLGGDAPFPRIETPIQFSFKLKRRFTRITRLVVLDLPAATTIEVRCRGGRRRGCFRGVKRVRVANGAAIRNVSRFVRKRKLRRRARVEVRVVRAASIGKVLRIKVRRRKAPTLSRRCLPPGARTPRKC